MRRKFRQQPRLHLPNQTYSSNHTQCLTERRWCC